MIRNGYRLTLSRGDF